MSPFAEVATEDIETEVPGRSPKVRLVAFAGPKGSGKDTAMETFKLVAERKGFKVVHLSFASPLKEAMTAMFGEVDRGLEWKLHGPSAAREGRVVYGQTNFTVRHALQTLGTEWGRKKLGQNVWVDLALECARKITDEDFLTVVVITDARFANEFARTREEHGHVWLIERPEEVDGRWFHRLFRWLTRHDSERAFYWPHEAAKHADVTIFNRSTLENFKQSVAKLALSHL